MRIVMGLEVQGVAVDVKCPYCGNIQKQDSACVNADRQTVCRACSKYFRFRVRQSVKSWRHATETTKTIGDANKV